MDNKTDTITAGERGQVLLQDIVLLDEMAHFDRERIPERVVHAKGAGESIITVVTCNIREIFRVQNKCFKLVSHLSIIVNDSPITPPPPLENVQ